jgi:hypothetical protein
MKMKGTFEGDKITEYEVGWTCSMQEADNKCVQYIMKKFFPVPSRPVTIHYEKN